MDPIPCCCEAIDRNAIIVLLQKPFYDGLNGLTLQMGLAPGEKEE